MINKIGIKIVRDKPENMERAKEAMEHCAFVGMARNDKKFYAQRDDISCPLARYNLGLDEPNDEKIRTLARTLVEWDDARTEDIGIKHLKSKKILPFEKKYILYFPIPNDDFKPDVIVEILSPDDAMVKARERTYRFGDPGLCYTSGVGAMCGECTAYPILTGKPNMSVGCSGSRPRAKLKRHEMFFAFPGRFAEQEDL